MHILRNDKDMIDILTIIWNQNQEGQLVASNNEIVCALKLVIRRCAGLFLVFDGVDECSDHDGFFDFLIQLSKSVEAISIALFSRPTIKIPNSLKPDCVLLYPGYEQNSSDIQAFLRPKIESLREERNLCSTADVNRISRRICERANGMFLWARLFISYLESPMLSPRARSEAIEHMNRLEGLDSLCRAILASLSHQFCHKDNVSRVFQFVAFAYRPLTVKELQHALAVPLDGKLNPDDIIPNFASNLSRITGALIETASDNTVRFIHLAVLEYLLDPTNSETEFKSVFKGSEPEKLSGHGLYACFCLSYLYYSVEHEPLGGSPQTAPDKTVQADRYPFLEYAAKYWSSHLIDQITEMQSQIPKQEKGELDDSLVRLAGGFLKSRKAITVWIEASYMFGFLPEIASLPRHKLETPQLQGIADQGALQNSAVRWLQRLSQDLTELNESWAKVLFESPNEIWESSISGFIRSTFWISAYGSKVLHFRSDSRDGRDSICLKSQVSADGQLLGVARLYLHPRDLADSTFAYELWHLDQKELRFEAEIRIPESLTVTQAGLFHFPVAMSADLLKIAIPGLIAKIRLPCVDSLEGANNAFLCTQRLSFAIPGPATDGLIPDPAVESFSKSYALQISDSGEFVFVIHRSSKLVDINRSLSSVICLVTVYQDKSSENARTIDHSYMGSIAFKPNKHRIMVHPYLPIASFEHEGVVIHRSSQGEHHKVLEDRESNTVLWDFGNQGNLPRIPAYYLELTVVTICERIRLYCSHQCTSKLRLLALRSSFQRPIIERLPTV